MSVIDTSAAPVPPAPKGLDPGKTVSVPAKRRYIGEIAAQAEQIRFARVILAVLTAPFYVVGFVVGLVWLLARWAAGGVVIGFRHAGRVRVGTEDEST